MTVTKIAYIDGIDWQHHVDDDSHGVKIYPSIKALKADSGHDLSECGIVEIELCEIHWPLAQQIRKGDTT